MLCKILNSKGESVFIIAEAVTAIEPTPNGSAIRLPGHTIYVPGTPEEAKAAIEAADEEAREEDRLAAAQRKITAGRKGAAAQSE